MRLLCVFALVLTPLLADHHHLEPADIFELEWASQPHLSPDGKTVVYVRHFFDKMADRGRSNLWTVGADGSSHRPLTSGNNNNGAPRWSPSGDRIAYVSTQDGKPQIWMLWTDNLQRANITNLSHAPGGLQWSPDGTQLAFSMFVPAKAKSSISMPPKPEGAKWADPPKVIDKVIYRRDGGGYVEHGYQHLFTLSADGGTPRQITSGDFHHDGPRWAPDGESILFSANRRDDWEYEINDSNVYRLALADGTLTQLTDRVGPENNVRISPDGNQFAYTGYNDRYRGYQVDDVYLADRDAYGAQNLTTSLDRGVTGIEWSADGTEIYFGYLDQGSMRIGAVTQKGERRVLVEDAGSSIGRPYAGGGFYPGPGGHVTYTAASVDRPADVAIAGPSGTRILTDLNADVLAHKTLGEVEEIWFDSSHDGRKIHGWIVKPPDFDPANKYPLILEIHGGPFAAYGPFFSAEMQIYAAAGYVVLYTNPRGSTSYGEEFGDLIHHAYPGNDYDDLMSGVDHVLAQGYVDADKLYITGGSGGGVLTSWSIGKTNRFAGAVVGKPVINWYSFALTADIMSFVSRYWFPGPPWEHQDHYMARSPISLVGNVETPTMVLTGESDYRTPMSESEQYYQALKLRKVESALVRVPGASHNIAARPSQLIAKTLHVLNWFDTHGGKPKKD